MKLTNHLHLVLKLRMCGTVPLLPSVCLNGVERENFTLTFATQHPRRHESSNKKKFLAETKFLLSCCIDFKSCRSRMFIIAVIMLFYRCK